MVRKRFFLVVMALSVGVLFSSLRAQENFAVTNVVFQGNQILSTDELKARITTHSIGWFKSTILRKSPFSFSQVVLDQDLHRLERFYQTEGCLYATVDSKIHPNSTGQTVEVIFVIAEGPPVSVGAISHEIQVSEAADREAAEEIFNSVRRTLALQPKARFRDESMFDDVQSVTLKFNQRGFPYADVDYGLTIKDSTSVDIHWTIIPGTYCRFGEVVVEGQSRIPEKLIRKHVAFKRGDRFDSSLLDESQRQIYDLGMFQVVTVKGLLLDPSLPRVPVEVQVKEAKRLSTRFGVGFGREEKFRTFVVLQRLGVIGGARRVQLILKHSALEPYHVDLKLTQPSFLTTKTTAILNPFLLRQNEPGFEVQRLGGNLTFQHKIARKTDAHITYTLEKVKQSNVADSTEQMDDRSNLDLYNKSSITLGLKRDTSHPVFTPLKGLFLGTSLTASGLGFNSEFHFAKLVFDVRNYRKIWGNVVLAGRVKAGSIQSFDDDGVVPVEERFFAGGSASVRGWPRSELGPKDELGTPIGGKSLIECSLELRIPIIGILSGVVFTDFGNVWLDSFGYDLTDLRYSIGAGLRIGTPIGPMRLDLARPVFDEETAMQIFISVGHAF